MSISAFEKTRDKMRAKCGLAVSPRRSNKKNLSDLMLTPSSNMKRSNSSSSVVSSTACQPHLVMWNGGGSDGSVTTTSQSDKNVIYKSPSQITTMQSTMHQPIMQSAVPFILPHLQIRFYLVAASTQLIHNANKHNINCIFCVHCFRSFCLQ